MQEQKSSKITGFLLQSFTILNLFATVFMYLYTQSSHFTALYTVNTPPHLHHFRLLPCWHSFQYSNLKNIHIVIFTLYWLEKAVFFSSLHSSWLISCVDVFLYFDLNHQFFIWHCFSYTVRAFPAKGMYVLSFLLYSEHTLSGTVRDHVHFKNQHMFCMWFMFNQQRKN
jgi:hypothetical protein